MPSKNPANLFKNLTCAAIGLLVLFTTSIFVIKGSYQTNINSMVDQATLLKDAKYPAWGQFPGNVDAHYRHLLTLYTHSPNNPPTPLPPVSLDYSYQYAKMNFGQGNEGTIKFLNQWQRKITPNQENLRNTPVNTINLAVQKTYNYEYFATDSRRFVLNFMSMWEAARDLLPTFYALYLSQFYLHDTQLVAKTIFDVIGLEAPVQEQLFSHAVYGWKVPENLAVWFRLVHVPAGQRASQPAFELIQEAVGVTAEELLALIDEKSTLFKLSMALNGTIKSKLEAKTLNYDACTPFCSDDQLIAVQLASGMLTNSPLMGTINLNKPLHLLNTSYSAPLQYNTFCANQFDFTCIDPKNTIDFFDNQGYSNFTLMSKVLTYRDNAEMVQTLFQVINPMQDGDYGRSVIGYLNYLNTYNFNSFDQDTQAVNLQSYKYIFPNYEFMLKTLNHLQNVMQSELLAIAMLAENDRNNLHCEDFFISNLFAGFKKLCDKKETDLSKLEGMRTFVRAYFFQNREEFVKSTGMDHFIATQFLRLNTGDSLFAANIKAVREDLAKLLACDGTVCSPSELIAREWGGDRPILSNLPIKYFPAGKLSIFDLDYNGQFHQVDPRYTTVIGQKIPLDLCLPLFGQGKQSILVLLNLVNYKLKADKGDGFSAKLVRYVQKSVLDSYFGSYFEVKTVEQLLEGFKSPYIQEKKKQQPMRGGAPWLPSSLSFIDMQSKPDKFSKINTGIYQKDKLRNIAQINEQSKASSDYTVFAAGFEEVHETLLSDKQVFGTNMLGFHQNVENDDALSVYLDFISYGTVLENTDSDYLYQNNISSFKYKLKNIEGRINMGIDEQNERYVIVDPTSYFVVEPQTGLTLEIKVKYSVYTRISSMALYNGQSNEYKLNDMDVAYSRENINSIVEINNKKFELFMLQMITIGLAAFSILLTIIFSIIYLRKRKNRKVDVMETLISDFPGNTVLIQS